MKISRSRLKEIIKEEYERMDLEEIDFSALADPMVASAVGTGIAGLYALY